MRELSTAQVQARQYSILDLCGFSTFSIVASTRSEWLNRFEQASKFLKQRLPREATLNLWGAGDDFYFTDKTHESLYNEKADFSKGGALLIRPDQHILSRFGPDTSGEDISNAVFNYLSL